MWFEDKLISIWSSLFYVNNRDEEVKRFISEPDSAMLCASSFLSNGYLINESIIELAKTRYDLNDYIFKLEDESDYEWRRIFALVSRGGKLKSPMDYYVVLIWDSFGKYLDRNKIG